MPLQLTDFIHIDRVGSNYKITAADILNLVQANLGTAERDVANIAARNALGGLSMGDRVRVLDATDDPTVNTGWAIYSYLNPGWLKIIEEEGLDPAYVTTNLVYVPGAAGGTVTNTNGSGFSIPLADAANAGLLSPGERQKIEWILVTEPVDLDGLEGMKHAPVTTAGNATNNPIVVTGQSLDFSISGLLDAP